MSSDDDYTAAKFINIKKLKTTFPFQKKKIKATLIPSYPLFLGLQITSTLHESLSCQNPILAHFLCGLFLISYRKVIFKEKLEQLKWLATENLQKNEQTWLRKTFSMEKKNYFVCLPSTTIYFSRNLESWNIL